MKKTVTLAVTIFLSSIGIAEVVDFGPDGVGGYPEIDVMGVSGCARIRVVYATHPDGLGEHGDFWHETRATYLGPSVWLPILPANTDRFDDFEVTSNGTYRASLAQGLVRYAKWTVVRGEAQVTAVRFANDGIHSEDPVVGSFECSDERLNGIWKASVRTCQLAAIPGRDRPIVVNGIHTNAVLGPMRPYLSDGAKRDRLVWSGDLWWAQRNMYVAFSLKSPYMPGSIRMLADSQLPCGYLQAAPFPEAHQPFADGDWGHFESDEFAAWFVPVLRDHVLHTGDMELAREQLPVVRRLLAYLARYLNGNEIFEQRKETCKGAAGLTFGAKSLHHRAYMQVLLWKTWLDAADLADWLGEENVARQWRDRAGRLGKAAMENFWDEGKGGFVFSLELKERCREANPLAVAFGLVSEAEAGQMFATHMRHKHGKFQALSIRGAFGYGHPDLALKYIFEHDWHRLLDPGWKGLRTTQECMKLCTKGWGDEAHPDTAIAGILSNSILGVEPLSPGYATFRVRPRTDGTIRWARGKVPVPGGMICVDWKSVDGRLVVNVENPQGTIRCK